MIAEVTSVRYWGMGVKVEGHGRGWGVIGRTHPKDDRVRTYSSHRQEIDGADPLDVIVSVEVSRADSAKHALEIVIGLGLTPVSLRGQYNIYGELSKAEREAKAAALEVLGHELPWWDDRHAVR